MSDFQLIVIGAGPGGYTSALTAARLGLKTAIIEQKECGGTCLNRGCIPTKALLHASGTYKETLQAGRMGLVFDNGRIDLAALNGYRQQTVDQLRGGVESLLKSAGISILRGKAQIKAGKHVYVEGPDEGTFSADNIIIATGSEPARPPIPGLELKSVVTSNELLEDLDNLPASIVIIGGGVIGVEFATFFTELGTDVTIVEGLDRLLPNMDRELGQSLALTLKKQNVKIFTGAMVEKVKRNEDRLQVCFTQKGNAMAAEADLVLCAIGRRPFTDGLFEEGLEVRMEGRRISVDENFKTSIDGIYAIGDVSSKIQLAHVAAAQGTACARIIAGKDTGMNLDIVPSCVYCRPEIASVGLTEAEAKQSGLQVTSAKCTLFSNARTIISDAGRSFMKVLADSQTGKIVGAQFMCQNASDMISQISEAIANSMTPDDLLKAMRPHPTYEEALSDVLSELQRKLEQK